MPLKTYSAEEIVEILRNIEILNDRGKSIADCCRDKGISEAIYYRSKKIRWSSSESVQTVERAGERKQSFDKIMIPLRK